MVYQQQGCVGCHIVNGEGSSFGPELTIIGAQRSLAYLRESVLNPSADVPPEFVSVRVRTREGKVVSGIRVNEDSFTIQMKDANNRFYSFRKADLAVFDFTNGIGHARLRRALPGSIGRSGELSFEPARRLMRPCSRCCLGALSLTAQVPYERLRKAEADPGNWLTYSGNLRGTSLFAADPVDAGQRRDACIRSGSIKPSGRARWKSRRWSPTA